MKTDRLKTPQVALGGHGKRSIAGRAGRDSVRVFHTQSAELTTQTECKSISNLCGIPENSPNLLVRVLFRSSKRLGLGFRVSCSKVVEH